MELSTAGVSKGPIAATLIRRFSMALYSHILLAVDFSPAMATVTQRAIALRQALKARLSLVHVVEFTQIDLSNDLILPQEIEIEQEMIKHAKQRLEELAKNIGIDKSSCFISQGSTRQEILRLAVVAGA
jgi:universal stress protein A